MHLRKRLISVIVFTLSLFIVISSVFYSRTTTAQASFVGSLPPGYTSYPGQLAMGKSCSCATGGISGAPAPAPACGTAVCYGSSSTRYGFISTKAEGINSRACKELSTRKVILPPCFQLDGDDAIVISGSMSPVQNLSYYGFTLYQSLTSNSNFPSNFAAIQSSVGANLNSANFKLGSNGKYIVIFTASNNTLNVIKRTLNSIGVPNAIINHYPVPASVANVGKVDYPDQLTLQLRLTAQSPEEKQQVNTFVQETAPETKVIYIKGPGEDGDITFDDIPKWEDTLRSNPIEYEIGLDRQLATLERSVTNTYARKGYGVKARLTESVIHVDTKECRDTASVGCVYDSPDAIYSSFPCDFSPAYIRNKNCYIKLEQNSDDVLMLLGVNHTLVGDKTLAAYFANESKIGIASKDGTFSFVGLYTEGSAKQYWPRSKGDNLYAVKITRDCGDSPYCAAVPFLGNPSSKTGFYIVGRTYLDKATASSPNPANLIPAVLLWFSKS
jgi:hypothetical protein